MGSSSRLTAPRAGWQVAYIFGVRTWHFWTPDPSGLAVRSLCLRFMADGLARLEPYRTDLARTCGVCLRAVAQGAGR